MVAVSLPHEHEDDNYLDLGDLEEIFPSHDLSMWKARYTLCQVCHPAVANRGQALSGFGVSLYL